MNLSTLCLGSLLALTAGCAANPGPHPAPSAAALPPAAVTKVQGDLYYFDHCARCDRLLGTRGDPVVVVSDGRHLRFCEQACAANFEAEAPASMAKLDNAMIADQAPLYPVDHSIVSGRPLGSSPVQFIWGNRLIRVVDAPERSQFLADPARYTAALDKATIEARWQGYPVIKCPVQGTRLEDEFNPRLAVVVAQRIIRVCCLDCAARVREQPSHYLPLIDLANRQAGIGRGKPE
jgi:hypothetical protein